MASQNEAMRFLSTIFHSFLFIFSGFLLLTAFPLALWLLFHFETLQGFILAILGLISPIWGFWLVFGKNRKLLGQVNGRWGCLISLLVLLLFWLAPSGKSAADSPIRHIYSNGGRFIRFSPFNIIPEIELMNVGTNLIGPLDPYIDRHKSKRLADLTLTIYREMRQNDNFRQVGSSMGLPLREPLQIPFDNGHTYLYIPKKASADHPVPVIVFLHGAGGPFKAYQWIWGEFAEEHGFIIVSPSYGMGVWPEKDGPEAVMRTLDYTADHVQKTDGLELNLDHVWLVGLSNGGYGAVHTAARYPDHFQGLILISPALPSPIMIEPDGRFNSAWRNRPVLLIHGEQDLRIPLDYINQHINFIKAGQVDIQTDIYPKEDHFLFFAQRKELMQTIRLWIKAQSEAS